jgi:hypothetical protein
MKKIILALALVSFTHVAFCQKEGEGDEETKKGFKKENIFIGGSGTLSFFNGSTVLGVNPYIGYSLNKFLDVAIVANVTYAGERDYTGAKYRQWVYGPGAFVRIFPVKMIFLHAGVEHNFISLKVIPPANSGGSTEKFKVESNSVLLGAGLASNREGTKESFYYISLMVDVSKSIYSPYTEVLQDGSLRAVPIIRAGIQIPLFQGKRGRGSD